MYVYVYVYVYGLVFACMVMFRFSVYVVCFLLMFLCCGVVFMVGVVRVWFTFMVSGSCVMLTRMFMFLCMCLCMCMFMCVYVYEYV